MKTIVPASPTHPPKSRQRAVLALCLLLGFGTSVLGQKPCPPSKVQICHKGKVVICVSPSAVAAHMAHGDSYGECTPTAPDCTVKASGGTITCARPDVTLSAASSVTGATYSWTGPNGFTATGARPVATVPGIYTVTMASAGCASVSDTALVTRDLSAPVVTATGGTLTCQAPSVGLSATSSTGGNSFSWTGPNGFTSTDARPQVETPGTYVVTAAHPVTGCTASNAAVVQQSLNAPVILTIQASGSGTITCANPSVVLTVTTTSSDVTYKWTGPNNFVSDSSMPVVTNPGNYHLTLSNKSNGCSSSASIAVSQNTAMPTDVTTLPAVLGTLTCTQQSLVLTGGSATTGVSYNWTGPNGFAASSRITTATEPGMYTLRVTDTANGCGSEAVVSVEKNVTTPAGVTVSNSEPLTCFTTEVALMGSSSTEAVRYSWSGPGGFTSSSPVATTGVAGTYTLTVTDLINGCAASASTTVEQNTALPADVAAQVSGVLTCSTTSVNLWGSSSSAGLDYNWFGPDGYFAATAEALTGSPGEYLLMVTDQVNGCSVTVTAIVEQDLSDCQSMAFSQLAQAGAVEVAAFPNPVRDKAVITFKVPRGGKATVALHSANGIREKVLFSQPVQGNQLYRLPVDASRLARGIHYCVVTVNNQQYTRKIVVLP